jgi:hypothetical protein
MIAMNEIYICKDCGNEHDSYQDLKHYSWESGGFCRACGGDRMKVLDLNNLPENYDEDEE